MGYNDYAALLGLLIICASSFAEVGVYDTGSTGAWEIDYSRCDRGGVDSTYYCEAYCEYQTEEECDPVSFVASETPQMIDQCVCTCGLSQEEVSFNSVPCMDLTRYGSPSGVGLDDSGDYSSSGCCLPMFLLVGVAAGAVWRRE